MNIEHWLLSKHFSDWAGFSIKQEDRRKAAVKWFADTLRDFLDTPDPPRDSPVRKAVNALDPRGMSVFTKWLSEAFDNGRDAHIGNPNTFIRVGGKSYTHKELMDMSLPDYLSVMSGHIGEVTNEALSVPDSPICSCARWPSSCPVHGLRAED